MLCIFAGQWNPPSAPLLDSTPSESSHLPVESTYFLSCNRNKRSCTINFKQPEGLKVLHDLIRKADVLVENFIPGKLAEMGLGWEDCRNLNDKLIYASISGSHLGRPPCRQRNDCGFISLKLFCAGYGQSGPYRDAAGYDVVIEAEAGLMHMCVCFET